MVESSKLHLERWVLVRYVPAPRDVCAAMVLRGDESRVGSLTEHPGGSSAHGLSVSLVAIVSVF